MQTDGDRVALAAFVTSALLAGGNAVCIRFSNRELDPLWGASLRFILAGAISFAILLVARVAIPRGRAFAGAALYGLFQFAGSFGLAYYALVRIQAGLGQTLLALVPLATLLVAVAQRQERLRPAAIVGSLLALAGVALVSRAPLQTSVPWLSLLAVLGSVLCFAEAAVLVRRLPRIHPLAMNAVGMTTAAVALAAVAAVAGDRFELPERTSTWIAIAYLVVLGSVAVFGLTLVVLRYWEASRYAYLFVLIPPVTLVLSHYIDDEPIGIGLVFGGLLIAAGVYVGALRRTATA